MDPNMTIRRIDCFRWPQTCPFLSIQDWYDWWAENARVVLTRARTHVLSGGWRARNKHRERSEGGPLVGMETTFHQTKFHLTSKLRLTSFYSFFFLFPGFDWCISLLRLKYVQREIRRNDTDYKWMSLKLVDRIGWKSNIYSSVIR